MNTAAAATARSARSASPLDDGDKLSNIAPGADLFLGFLRHAAQMVKRFSKAIRRRKFCTSVRLTSKYCKILALASKSKIAKNTAKDWEIAGCNRGNKTIIPGATTTNNHKTKSNIFQIHRVSIAPNCAIYLAPFYLSHTSSYFYALYGRRPIGPGTSSGLALCFIPTASAAMELIARQTGTSSVRIRPHPLPWVTQYKIVKRCPSAYFCISRMA